MFTWPDEGDDDPGATLGDDDEGDEVLADDVDDGAQPCAEASEIDPAILELIREVEDPTGGEKFERKARPQLPQPDRARSVPNLPKVRSNAFTRILR